MHRIDHSTATIDNRFTEGDPQQGIPATVVTAKWLNAVQEEVVNVIEDAGMAPDDAEDNQLLAAIDQKIAAATPPHDHDDRYYTESDIDSQLANKADNGHDHDGRYYSEAEVDTQMAGKSDLGHGHGIADVSGLQSALNAKANTGHGHSLSDLGVQSTAAQIDSRCRNAPVDQVAYSTTGATVGAGTQQFVTLNLGNVTAGDYGMVIGTAYLNKTTNPGNAGIGIDKASGSANMTLIGTSNGEVKQQGWFEPGGVGCTVSVTAPIEITASGNLVLELNGFSAVSSTAFSQLYLRIVWLKKQ
jgi:hypothetical protein